MLFIKILLSLLYLYDSYQGTLLNDRVLFNIKYNVKREQDIKRYYVIFNFDKYFILILITNT